MWIKFYTFSGSVRLALFVMLVTAMPDCAAQTGRSVIIGSMVARPNALLYLNPPDKNQGFLVPQLTTTQRLSMRPSSPQEDGLFLFDITESSFYVWKSGGWVKGLGNELSATSLLSGITAAGDLSGSYLSPNVVALQGNAVSPGTLSSADAGKVLMWNGKQWAAQPMPVPVTIPRHVTVDPSAFTNLRRGDKKDKDNIIMFDDNTTYVTTIKKNEGPYIIAPLSLPDGATIQEVSFYYVDNEANNVVIDVYRKSPTGSNEEITNTWTSAGSSAAIQTALITPVSGKEIVDNNYSYRIVVKLDQSIDVVDSSDATLRIYAVKVKYVP